MSEKDRLSEWLDMTDPLTGRTCYADFCGRRLIFTIEGRRIDKGRLNGRLQLKYWDGTEGIHGAWRDNEVELIPEQARLF